MKISDECIKDIICQAGESFDSHEIIRRIAHREQHQYIEALYECRGGDFPFQTLHASLGRRITGICEELGYEGKASSSRDIFGQDSSCIHWQRR
jgi:hypothetical protein